MIYDMRAFEVSDSILSNLLVSLEVNLSSFLVGSGTSLAKELFAHSSGMLFELTSTELIGFKETGKSN